MLAESYLRSGKVRDLYQLPDQRMVLVASDRLSAFDVVLPTTIPDKGRVLTGLSRFWFAETAGIVPNHLLDTDIAVLDEAIRTAVEAGGAPDADYGPLDDLRGRIMICRPAEVVPVEAVVRGYLAGSGLEGVPGARHRLWHRVARRPPGERPPAGADLHARDEGRGGRARPQHQLRWHDRAPAAGLGPGRKRWRRGGRGHPGALASALRVRLGDRRSRPGSSWRTRSSSSASRQTWTTGPGRPAEERVGYGPVGNWPEPLGSGRPETRLILIDEALTPNSSRFWDASTYEPGGAQASFDKQFVRDWLETQPWAKTAPGPALPDEVVEGTRARYVEAFERITGASFERYLTEDVIAP